MKVNIFPFQIILLIFLSLTMQIINNLNNKNMYNNWWSLSLSELTQIISYMELTHLGSETSSYGIEICLFLLLIYHNILSNYRENTKF